jgi:hypothetical protein
MLSPSDLQPELALRERAQIDDASLAVNELCGLLRGRGWLMARELMALRPGWTERAIRAIASASGGRVVSGPGMPGYCLHDEVALDEMEHAGRSLISQGRTMMRRGIEFLRQAKLRRLAAPKGTPSHN